MALTVVAGWLVVRGTARDDPPAAGGDPRPTAAVALGDSFASGEGAGGYVRDAGGAEDPCRRSAAAQIHRAELRGIDQVINLACSGATTADLRLGGPGRHGHPSQAEQLRTVATRSNVELVVVTVGANDLGWGQIVLDCALAHLAATNPCQDAWASRLPGRVQQVTRRIEQAVRDLRTVMRAAGQDDGDYQLVLQGYASPVPRSPRPLPPDEQAAAGCPIPADAMAWAHQELMPRLAGMVRDAAAASGARFLDLTRAFDGHQVCAPGARAATEWVHGVQVGPRLAGAPPSLSAAQLDTLRVALHPNALGHAQLGRCLERFLQVRTWQAACQATADGDARVR